LNSTEVYVIQRQHPTWERVASIRNPISYEPYFRIFVILLDILSMTAF